MMNLYKVECCNSSGSNTQVVYAVATTSDNAGRIALGLMKKYDYINTGYVNSTTLMASEEQDYSPNHLIIQKLVTE